MDVSERFARGVSSAALAVVLLSTGACSSNDGDPTDAGGSSTTTPTAGSDEERPPRAPTEVAAAEAFEALESAYDVRLGVYAVETGTEREIAYRADERFGHASTFKALLCGVVLQQRSVDDLDRVITYSGDDLVAWSPITETRVGTGMSIGELCEAAVSHSDNTATNLLLDEVGGPSGLQQALRENGDDVISTDRYEVEMS
jgi:beta-lactamase class A